MKPPKSTAGRVATSLGILVAGAAAGGAAGYVAMPAGAVGPTGKKSLGAAVGALGGVALASLASLGLTEFLPNDWEDVERMTALLGGGGLAALVGWGVVREFGAVAGAAPSGAPALPAASTSGENFAASTSDAGRTLNLAAGDTVTVTLPAPQGAQWSWAGAPGLVTLTSNGVSGDVQTTVFTAVAGSGQIVATPSGGGGQFTLTLNVS